VVQCGESFLIKIMADEIAVHVRLDGPKVSTVRGEVPVAELFPYPLDLRSIGGWMEMIAGNLSRLYRLEVNPACVPYCNSFQPNMDIGATFKVSDGNPSILFSACNSCELVCPQKTENSLITSTPPQ